MESHEENPKGLEHPHHEYVDLNWKQTEVRCPRGLAGGKAFPSAFLVCIICCVVGETNWDMLNGGGGGGVEGISAGWTCGGHAAILSSQTLRKKLVCKLAFPKKRNKTLEPDSCRGFLLCKLFFNTKK